MNEYPKELIKAIDSGMAGQCQSVVIRFKGKAIEAIEVIREYQKLQPINELLKEAAFQEIEIKQHHGKCTYIQQKIKIRVNHQPGTSGKFQTCKATQNLRSQSTTDALL